MIRILVVDDSALVRKLFGRVLSAEPDFEVRFARNGLEALAQLDEYQPDVVTLDVQMPQMDGLECLDRIMVQRPCPVVMVSTITAEGAAATLDALKLGAVDFVAKPAGAVSLGIDEFARASDAGRRAPFNQPLNGPICNPWTACTSRSIFRVSSATRSRSCDGRCSRWAAWSRNSWMRR